MEWEQHSCDESTSPLWVSHHSLFLITFVPPPFPSHHTPSLSLTLTPSHVYNTHLYLLECQVILQHSTRMPFARPLAHLPNLRYCFSSRSPLLLPCPALLSSVFVFPSFFNISLLIFFVFYTTPPYSLLPFSFPLLTLPLLTLSPLLF